MTENEFTIITGVLTVGLVSIVVTLWNIKDRLDAILALTRRRESGTIRTPDL